jgi:hypothetical protein
MLTFSEDDPMPEQNLDPNGRCRDATPTRRARPVLLVPPSAEIQRSRQLLRIGRDGA